MARSWALVLAALQLLGETGSCLRPTVDEQLNLQVESFGRLVHAARPIADWQPNLQVEPENETGIVHHDQLWHRCLGIGVAGNVAGHMAQAGEAEADAAPTTTPAGIFMFYLPHPAEDHKSPAHEAILDRLGRFPVTNSVIVYPSLKGADKVQVEPEMALYVDIVYARDGVTVERLIPRWISAFNDCSIRQLDGSEKLSEKKNWGYGSKGISLQSFRVNSFSKGGLLDSLILISYIKRQEEVHQYSVAARARSYLMFYEPLLEWIVSSMNYQNDTGKWENISEQLAAADYPTSAWIALGAGEYTQWGETNYLKPKDESLVVIYDERAFPNGLSNELISSMFKDARPPAGLVAVHQTFVQSEN